MNTKKLGCIGSKCIILDPTFIPIKGIILNNFLPAAVKHIRRMEMEKTPNKKI